MKKFTKVLKGAAVVGGFTGLGYCIYKHQQQIDELQKEIKQLKGEDDEFHDDFFEDAEFNPADVGEEDYRETAVEDAE